MEPGILGKVEPGKIIYYKPIGYDVDFGIRDFYLIKMPCNSSFFFMNSANLFDYSNFDNIMKENLNKINIVKETIQKRMPFEFFDEFLKNYDNKYIKLCCFLIETFLYNSFLLGDLCVLKNFKLYLEELCKIIFFNSEKVPQPTLENEKKEEFHFPEAIQTTWCKICRVCKKDGPNKKKKTKYICEGCSFNEKKMLHYV